MAKQAGILTLTGPIGNVSFYKSNGEYRARAKSGPSRKQVLKSKRFARTRENAAEFKAACRASMLVRRSLYGLTRNGLADNAISGRMNGLMLKVIQADTVHGRGERKVCSEGFDLLETFNFSSSYQLSSVFPVGPVTSMDGTTGAMRLQIRSFDPAEVIQSPVGATHFKIVCVAAAIDFARERMKVGDTSTDYLSLDGGMVEAIDMLQCLPAEAGVGKLLAMGIVFYAATTVGTYTRVAGGAMRVLHCGMMEERVELPDPVFSGNRIGEEMFGGPAVSGFVQEDLGLVVVGMGSCDALNTTDVGQGEIGSFFKKVEVTHAPTIAGKGEGNDVAEFLVSGYVDGFEAMEVNEYPEGAIVFEPGQGIVQGGLPVFNVGDGKSATELGNDQLMFSMPGSGGDGQVGSHIDEY